MVYSVTQNLDEILDDRGFVKGTNRYIGGHGDPLPIGTVYKGIAFLGRKQKKSKVAQDSQILDESLENFKHPNADLDVSQKIANPGETVPLIFGKRVNNIGGIWIKPSLIKAGTDFHNQKLLYVISQGEVASSPEKSKTFTGLKRINFLDDQSITLNHIFNTAAALTNSPNTCPINGTGLFCGNDFYSYLNPTVKTSGSTLELRHELAVDYVDLRLLTRGSGDTSNTTFTATHQIFDAETGANITTAYNNYTGYTGTTTFIYNARFDSNYNLIGGRTVGTITSLVQDFFSNQNIDLASPNSDPALLQVSNGRTKFVFKVTVVAVNNQTNQNLPASTGTLEGVQEEVFIGTSNNIQNTSDDNSSFADITFLATTGNLYENPSSGTFPSETKQLYVFYDEGVKCDLYSQGLTGSNYLNGASNQFLDLAMHLFKIYKKIDGNNTASIVAPVDVTNLQNLSNFCSNNNMFFNGIISKNVNIVEFISNIAPYYFLAFLSVGGKYKFASTLPLDNNNQIKTTSLTVAATFTEQNVLNGSLRKIFINVEDKRDFVANVIYTNCIPTEVARRKTVTVRYSTTEIDAPVEQFDFSEFCVSVDHAILYSKYELAKRKHSSHDVSFSTNLVTTDLIPTDIIKLELQRETSAGDNRSETDFYQITSITYNTNGVSTIQASHFPLNNNNVSLISNDIINGNFKILE
tara:strand:+ start:4972 stop:7050 length:2079 start_codon:yes stop_codon:yes gene_type:complete